jgi:hypothetical protein
MKKLSKRSDAVRRLESLKRHFWLVIQSSCLAIVIEVLWYWARRNGFHFSKEDETPIVAAIAILIVPYSMIAGFVLAKVSERFDKIVFSILKKDKETFLCYRDERLPIVLYLLIGAFSLPILGMTGSLEYKYTWSGFACVFSASFVLGLYWIVIVKLQNPTKSQWLAERIPQEWLDVDIDDHFKLAKE